MTQETSTTPPKRFIDLSVQELEEIVANPETAPSFSWEGLEQRKDFQRIFKHRANPRFIAQTLLKDKVTDVYAQRQELKEVKRLELQIERTKLEQAKVELDQKKAEARISNKSEAPPTIDPNLAHEAEMARVRVREMEAKAKLAKSESQTLINEKILKKLNNLDRGMTLLVSRVEELMSSLPTSQDEKDEPSQNLKGEAS